MSPSIKKEVVKWKYWWFCDENMHALWYILYFNGKNPKTISKLDAWSQAVDTTIALQIFSFIAFARLKEGKQLRMVYILHELLTFLKSRKIVLIAERFDYLYLKCKTDLKDELIWNVDLYFVRCEFNLKKWVSFHWISLKSISNRRNGSPVCYVTSIWF